MNFLQLCQAVARESGTVAGLSSFTTVTGASGRLDKLVNWVRDAWVEIQNERTDWLFRITDFAKPLLIGQNQYTGVSFGLDVSSWLPDTCNRTTMSLYDPAIGVADEGAISQVCYDEWRRTYNFGAQTNNRPRDWAVAPDGSLCLGPAPDKAYVLRGQYRRKAQQLVLDTDTPIVSEDYHGVIIAQALRNMANSDEEYPGLIPKAQKYEAVRNALVLDQTPQVYSF